MFEKARGGYGAMQIHHLNGRLFQKLLKNEPKARYRSEQGKILTPLWMYAGKRTFTDIALASGLANNTLTTMLKRMEKQGLVTIGVHPDDKRKKMIYLTELGWEQKTIGQRVSDRLGDFFYSGFSQAEIDQFEAFQARIIRNLRAASRQVSI